EVLIDEGIQRLVGPDYFRIMGIAIERGRAFTADDRENTAPAAIVSRRTAERLWPGQDPIGRRFQFADTTRRDVWLTVVGVSEPVLHHELDGGPGFDVYRYFAQAATNGPWYIVRTEGDPAALAAAATAVGLVVGLDREGVDAALARALERAASAAEVRAPDLPPGKYLYVRQREAALSTVGDPPPYSFLMPPSVTESWSDRDGDGRFVSREVGRARFGGPRDRRRWEANGRRPPLPKPSGRVVRGPIRGLEGGYVAGASQLTYEQLAALPTDGEAMYEKLLELAGDAGPTPDVEAFVIVSDLLRAAPVPRRVRAGLYRATAHIEGIELVGEVRDPLGRKGLAVALEHEGQRRQLIFDPQTSTVLAEEEVLTERNDYVDGPPGFPLEYRVVERQAVVDRIGERPPRR
ncbi:MAG TPA: CU044_5270 family protein, partial [Solirubrobacteraceae bacterium]|nr:CU044_5270 family protein [Solirubrobacteraceae bacterium]